MIVLDASAAVALLLAGSSSDRLRDRLRRDGQPVHAPHLIDLEVLHSLRKMSIRGALSDERAALALVAFDDLPMVRYPHLPFRQRIWELRNNCTPYDAAYVALAEVLDAPLVTLDSKLASAPGVRARVELI